MDCSDLSWAGLIGLGAAVAAAIGAWRAAAMTRRASEAQIVFNALAEYDSEDMLVALRTLRSWRETHGATFASDWSSAIEVRDQVAIRVDQARRRVSGYFQHIVILYGAGLITKRGFRAATCLAGLGILFDVVEPLERELAPTVDLSAFRTVERICGPKAKRGLLRPLPPPGRKGEGR
jgi:hypothetical protein